MDLQQVGRILLIVGGVVVLLGLILVVLGRLPFVSQLGSLPGDIRIEGSGFTCLIPIVSSILISVLLTIIINIILRLLNR